MILKKEEEYSKKLKKIHLKKFGQYFTNYEIAKFMVNWACEFSDNMLDPAVGNSIFFKYVKKINPNCKLIGYEIDNNIIEYFDSEYTKYIKNEDYLLSNWNKKYDSIVCNPPYSRFQSIEKRNEIIEIIYKNTGEKFSGYSNLYVLFLRKSIFQLSDKGKLAYIIPTDFLNSKYGIEMKNLLIKNNLIKAIINFKNNKNLFFNATTTSCILLLDNSPKKEVKFYNLNNIKELCYIDKNEKLLEIVTIEYSNLDSTEKWKKYFYYKKNIKYKNLVKISKFCQVKRGIATGNNDYFCLSKSKILKYKILMEHISKCVCKSSDVKNLIFKTNDFNQLSKLDKKVYILDITKVDKIQEIQEYLELGIQLGVHKKYIPSRRKKWFTIETKKPSPIWVSSAYRDKIKFIRNLSMVKNLTTFHSMFIKEEYTEYTDIIFCYFLTSAAQEILQSNSKELGEGLQKFQPNDLNFSDMLDVTIISSDDKTRINKIFENLKKCEEKYLYEKLDKIFNKYLK